MLPHGVINDDDNDQRHVTAFDQSAKQLMVGHTTTTDDQRPSTDRPRITAPRPDRIIVVI